MDNKYENGKIYQIYSPSRPDLVYIGSTIGTLKKRLGVHLSKYKRWKMDNTNQYISSFQIYDECEDYKIHLILNYPCDSRKELTEMEGKYIRMYGTVNKCIAGRTVKQYQIDNKVSISEYRKKYDEMNRGKKKRYNNKYRLNNKEKFKKYEESRREKIKEKIICACGLLYRKKDRRQHERSIKHNKIINSL